MPIQTAPPNSSRGQRFSFLLAVSDDDGREICLAQLSVEVWQPRLFKCGPFGNACFELLARLSIKGDGLRWHNPIAPFDNSQSGCQILVGVLQSVALLLRFLFAGEDSVEAGLGLR